MDKPQKDSIYLHAAIIIALLGLVYLLIQAIFILPIKEKEKDEAYRKISFEQIQKISKAQELYKLKFNRYTDSFDTLFAFLNSMKKMYDYNAVFNIPKDSQIIFDSLKYSPKTHSTYILIPDTTITLDTIFNKNKQIVGIQMGQKIIGKKLTIKCPDGYLTKKLE